MLTRKALMVYRQPKGIMTTMTRNIGKNFDAIEKRLSEEKAARDASAQQAQRHRTVRKPLVQQAPYEPDLLVRKKNEEAAKAALALTQQYHGLLGVVRGVGMECATQLRNRRIRPNMTLGNLPPKKVSAAALLIHAWGVVEDSRYTSGRLLGGSRLSGVWQDGGTDTMGSSEGTRHSGFRTVTGAAITEQGLVLGWRRVDQERRWDTRRPDTFKRGSYEFVEMPLSPTASPQLIELVPRKWPNGDFETGAWERCVEELASLIFTAVRNDSEIYKL